jgi:hypothetical protein
LNLATPTPINYRLPTNFLPRHYDLKIKPYFDVNSEPKEFDGKVIIKMDCVESTSRLVLHMKDIDIYNVSISSDDDSSFATKTNFNWTYTNITDFFIADFSNIIFKANKSYTFTAEYKGYSKNDNVGIYRSSYLDSNNKRR